MPEYLSPGVFIEEVPAALSAIEGVSTSTAAFVGAADRGTVPGLPLPFTPGPGFTLAPDPAPVLVTSFGEFTRQFGPPLPLPDPDSVNFLAYAVRAFFDNGGKRAYIARVVDPESASSSHLQLSQGTVLRLARSARAGDVDVFFTSLRGVSVNTQLSFHRRADGSDASASPAVVTGTLVQPFAMAPGDQIGVSVDGGAAVNMTAIAATSAQVISGGETFDLSTLGSTPLLVRVGPPAAPVQSVTFQSVDFGGTFNAATAIQVAAVLNRDLTGVSVVASGGKLTILTDQRGSGARLQILASQAATLLGLATSPSSGTGNVGNVAAVTVAEIAALFTPSGFTVGDDGGGRLRFTGTAFGPTETLQIVDTVVGTAAKLGLGTGAVNGAGGTLKVLSYNTGQGSVHLDGPLPGALDPGQVYATIVGAEPVPLAGPVFWARSPGAWSEDVSVLISPADKSAVPITAPASAGAGSVQVQNSTSFYVGAIVEIDHGGVAKSQYEVTRIQGTILDLAPGLTANVAPANTIRVLEIDVQITDETGVAPIETYRGLSWNQGPNADLLRHYATPINAGSTKVFVQAGPAASEGPTLTAAPVTPNGFPVRLGDGTVGNATVSGDADYIGTDGGPGLRTGIQSLIDVDEIRIVAAPGRTGAAVQNELIAQCELLRYRFAVLDGEQDPPGGSVAGILAHRNLYDTSFAAYYVPWVGLTVGDVTYYLPPSGYVAGVYARVDDERGVFKAPANEVLFNVPSLKSNISTGEQDVLNPRGVNAIRFFSGRGFRVWGARTLSSRAEVRYINVRRTLIYLEASIDRGTQFVVFEPNAPETWSRVTDSVSAFLNTAWREGALFGRRPEDAYFVRCDETTMTADDIQNGRLICQIGVAIVRPAEFVIFRIEQITGFANQ
jgi:phage tail sheath protein FI